MRHEYSNATTKRYIEWLAKRTLDGETDPPPLREIESWLRRDEDYRNPLRALMNLCVGLRDAEYPAQIQWIACELARELEDERGFCEKVESFFTAVVSRYGVDDFNVAMYDKRGRRPGTLHELHPETSHDKA